MPSQASTLSKEAKQNRTVNPSATLSGKYAAESSPSMLSMQRAVASPATAIPEEILSIQRSYGNKAVQQMLANQQPAATNITAASSSIIQREVIDDPNLKPSDKSSHALLSKHIEKKSAEHKVLDENWNINADGRNQGLAHIIDYAYARPKIGDAKNDPHKLPALAEGSDEKDQAAHKRFVEGHSATGAQIKKFFPAMKPKESKALLQELPMPADKALTGEEEALKLRRTALTKGFKKEEFAAFARSEEGQALKRDEDALKQRKLDATVYTRAQADSKRGRVERIAKGTGRDKDAFKGNEILGVTEAIKERLEAHPEQMKTPQSDKPKAPTYREKGWIPSDAEKADFSDTGKIRRYDKQGQESSIDAAWRTGERDVPNTHEFSEGDLMYEEEEDSLHVSTFGPKGKPKLSSAY